MPWSVHWMSATYCANLVLPVPSGRAGRRRAYTSTSPSPRQRRRRCQLIGASAFGVTPAVIGTAARAPASSSMDPKRASNGRSKHPTRKLNPRCHLELAERLSQVVFDSARADEQLSRDLAIRVPLRRKTRDLSLLRGQLVERVDRPLPGMLAGRLELDTRALRERVHAEFREHLVREAQLGAGVHPAPFPSQPLAIEEV